jgi:HTH-type transcriptional regulator/antitoxin HipB
MSLATQSTSDIGRIVFAVSRVRGLSHSKLALAAGTGLRFVHDFESGKPTLQLGKVLQVLQALGIDLELKQRTGEKLAAAPADEVRRRVWRQRRNA